MSEVSTKEIFTEVSSQREADDVFGASFSMDYSPSSWVSFPVSSFVSYVDSIVEERLQSLLQEKGLLEQIRDIDDDVARQEIKQFIIKKRKKGAKQISIVEISMDLQLPVEQIEKIMDVYEKEGKVKGING